MGWDTFSWDTFKSLEHARDDVRMETATNFMQIGPLSSRNVMVISMIHQNECQIHCDS